MVDQLSCNSNVVDDDDHGWTKVVSRKRNRKQKPADVDVSGNIVPNERQIMTAEMVSADVEEELISAVAVRNENLKTEETEKPKLKKDKKKPIVSLSEAMAKIDQSCLAALIVESLEKYPDEPEMQLLSFLDYIGKQLTEVQFPWLKMFPFKGPWPKLIDVINVPLCDIPEPIYKTSVDWIKQVPITTIADFVIWGFRRTIIQLQSRVKFPTFGEQRVSLTTHLAIFVTLVMVLRTRPRALTIKLPSIREMSIFQGQDKLPLTVWLMAQASCGYVAVGLGSWAHNLLPVVGDKNCNPQSRDLILQLVEEFHNKIQMAPNRRMPILLYQAVREQVRLIPPPSFEILLRLTFPASSARVKATARFEAVYPMLKEVALAGASGGKAMKQFIQQIFTLSLKLAGEKENPALAKEATSIATWCVTQNLDCCKDWDNIYKENLEASVAVLKKLKEVALAGAPGGKAMKEVIQQIFTLSLKLAREGNPALAKEATANAVLCLTENVDCCKDWDNLYEDYLEASVAVLEKLVDEWKDHSLKLASSPSNTLTVHQTMKSFRLKNGKAITKGGANAFLYEEADKSCKSILWRLSRGYCLKATAAVLAAAGVTAAAVLFSNLEATTELKNLYANVITTALENCGLCIY